VGSKAGCNLFELFLFGTSVGQEIDGWLVPDELFEQLRLAHAALAIHDEELWCASAPPLVEPS